MDVVIASPRRLFADVIGEALRVTAPDVRVRVVVDLANLAGAVAKRRPSVVLVDDDLVADVDAARDVLAGLRVLLVTGRPEPEAKRKARELGCDGIVGHGARLAEVRDLVRSECGDLDVVGALPPDADPRQDGRRRHGLTPREFDVLQMLTMGADNTLISRRLGITPNTVRTHVQNIFTKLDVSSRLAAATYAIRTGIVSPLPSAETLDLTDGELAIEAHDLEQAVTQDGFHGTSD